MSSADQLLASLQGIEASSFANEAERIRARDALFDTLRKVQSPWDVAWDHVWVNGATIASAKTLIDIGVFKKWQENGYKELSCAELAKLTGADEVLLSMSVYFTSLGFFSSLPSADKASETAL